MILDPLFALGPALLAACIALGLLAGFVKGTTGFAMPMVLISGLGSFLSPEAALAGLILPTVVTNVWQAFRQGWTAAVHSARTHWRFLGLLSVFIALSAQLVPVLSGATLYVGLGLAVVVFAALQLAGWRPRVHEGNRRIAEIAAGTVAGAIGGLAGVWGPPTVMYLTAMNTPKVEAVRVQGVVYGIGAVVLALAHMKSGVLTAATVPLSVLVLIPALAGMAVGFAVQDRLDQAKFRRVTLAVLVIAGFNLIRRGLTG